MEVSLSLEAELKNFFYTAGPYVPVILQAVYEDAEESIVNIPLKFDLLHLFRNHLNIARILVNQYSRFLKLLSYVVFQIAVEEISRSGSQYLRNKISALQYYDFNCYIDFKDCLINQKDVRNLDFLDHLSKSRHGTLMYLKECLVVETFPPQVYLYRWIQKLHGCSCERFVKKVKKGQTFADVLNSGQMKQRSKATIEICNVCDRIFSNCQLADQVYLNCQRIRVYCPSGKEKKKNLRSYSNSLIDVYLNFDKINKLEVGDCVDLCCYFNTQRRTKAIVQSQKIKMEEASILLCVSSYASQASPHSQFFNRIESISIQYTNCKPNEYLKLYSNYKEIIQAVNQIQFSSSYPKAFTLLKLSILASVFLTHPLVSSYTQKSESLSLLILTDEESIVNRIVKLEHLNCRQFPTNYDPQTAAMFLLGCHNCVLIFNNPTKKDFEYIEQAIRGEVGDSKNKIHVNITVWVVMNPLSKPKEFMVDMFDVIVDVTFIENINNRQVNHQIAAIIDVLVENYCPKVEFSNTMVRGKRKYRDLGETTFKNEKQSERAQEGYNGLEFLEQYYIAARQHKKTNLSNFMSLRKVAIGIAAMRRFFTKQKTPANVEFIDAIMSVFLDEETTRNKRGNSNTLLANQIAKFLLNEKDEMTVHEFVFHEEDFQEVQRTIHNSSVFIRIVDELRRIVNSESIA